MVPITANRRLTREQRNAYKRQKLSEGQSQDPKTFREKKIWYAPAHPVTTET
jgi:hypothetical protein